MHFVETIRQFGKEINLNLIRHYNEMSTPLPFILYALWGRIFGFEVHILRYFSMIIAFITYILFYWLLFKIFNDVKISFLTAGFFMINPYAIGLSVFVYTDMLPILFSIICCLVMIKPNPVIFAISLAGALLSRQYFVFFGSAACLYYLLKLFYQKESYALRMLVACIISFLPIFLLIFLWKGLNPDNAMRKFYYAQGLSFQPNSIILYVLMFFVYFLPNYIISLKILL
ncbi:MAG: hypothetical protein OEW70_01440 [candidate division WOR-3 bacterium]|nr:hypothetical protein [candidate division WOR-3 bacterium]